jgi:cytochrome c oxidase assembly protein Cox11
MKSSSPDDPVQIGNPTGVIDGQPMQVASEAAYALARRLVEQSVETSRDFSKAMLQIAFAAVPVYVAIHKEFSIGAKSYPMRLMQFLPNVLFLASALCFIFAFLPKQMELVVNVTEFMEADLKKAAQKRSGLNTLGATLFVLGVACGCVLLTFVLG